MIIMACFFLIVMMTLYKSSQQILATRVYRKLRLINLPLKDEVLRRILYSIKAINLFPITRAKPKKHRDMTTD
ncbi:hypothetical protein B5C26_22120 [Photorhabdus luminescens]|nr:hypothetical protein B5C26_22120 [Photorhabdus luminescens]